MTASILFFNQSAAVVASDTLAVRGGPDGDCSWPSASKIFEVSGHPVVVMASGNATIADVHLQLLIPRWISQLDAPFDTLEEYADSFLELTSEALVELGISDQDTVPGVIDDELRDFATISGISRSLSSGDLSDDDLDEVIRTELETYNENAVEGDPFDDLDLDRTKEILDHLDIDLLENLREVLDRPSLELSRESTNGLIALALIVLSRYVPCSSSNTLLNFVGYGQGDLTPGHVPIDVRGFWGTKVRAWVYPRRPEHNSKGASWDTQAQSDAMDGFLKGIDHRLWDDVTALAARKVAALEDVTEEQVATFAHELNTEMAGILAERYADRFASVLWSLSVPGMVRAADTLMTLQELRAATRGGPARVGGPIEVVSIERHAGVTWHRRLQRSPLTGDVSIHPLA